MKKKMTASHLALYVALSVYFLVAVVGLAAVVYMISLGEYVYASETIIGLYSFCGVCGTSTIVFYCNKAKAENEISLQNCKYDKRMELAKDVCAGIKDGELNENSVRVLKVLISDTDVSDNINGEG